jgi:ABC-type microcin C transport system permease subunit YejE
VNQHFPVFSERIELIAKELKRAKPDSMGGLLRDRRDELQYWTFWPVSIFGSISIILSLVILQGIQLNQK